MRIYTWGSDVAPAPSGEGVLGLGLQVPTAFATEEVVLRRNDVTVRIWTGRILKVRAAMGAELGFLRHLLAAFTAIQHKITFRDRAPRHLRSEWFP